MFKFSRLIASSLILGMLLPAMVTVAQTAEPSAGAGSAREIILQAMHALMAESYHYHSENTLLSLYTGDGGAQQFVVTLTSADGDVAPGGDNHMTLTSAGGATVDEAKAASRVALERIVADGVTYLNLTDEMKEVLPDITADSGWYMLDDLLAKIDNTPVRAGLQNLANVAMPAKLLVGDKYVLGVTEEAATDTVDGVEARVYDVRLDGFSMAVDQSPGTVVDHLKELYKNRQFYDAATFDYQARVWLDADGNPLRLDITSHTVLPYLSAGKDMGLSYDIDITSTGEVTLSAHGVPVEIEAPATLEKVE